MFFMRKSVLCSNCGFFCWSTHSIGYIKGSPARIDEINSYFRNNFQQGSFDGVYEDGDRIEISEPYCLRNQWVWAPDIQAEPYSDSAKMRVARYCIYYIRYQPGFHPEEHKELERDAQTRSTVFKATIIGAVIGASAAILAQLLYALFSN